MYTQFYIPNFALQSYIDAYIHLDFTTNSSLLNKPLDFSPLGSTFLSFVLKEPDYFYKSGNNSEMIRFNFSGQMDHYHFLQTAGMSVICLKFKPYGAFKLLGLPQVKLKNQVFDVEELLGNEVKSIKQKMLDHSNQPGKVIQILEEWLLNQLDKNRKINTTKVEYICDLILIKEGRVSIKELNKECLISKSSMEQHFNDKVGLSPKVFSRIIRFQHLVSHLKKNKHKDWMHLVNEFGYYDQSHFIHDFKHFFGYTPTNMNLSQFNISEKLSQKLQNV